MTHVLILGRTEMKHGHCVGGMVLEDGRNVRLQKPNGYSQPNNTPLGVGEIWNLQLSKLPSGKIVPPHTEDVGVRGVYCKQFVRRLNSSELEEIITRRYSPATVHPKQLINGKIKLNKFKRARIWSGDKVPSYSVGFWRLDKALHRCENNYGQIRYAYCSVDVSCDLDDDDLGLDVPYKGVLHTPINCIPAGTILRFSLGRIFKGSYWLQLSGWFM